MSNQTAEKESLEVGFHVGPFLVEPQLQRISKEGAVIQVEPKVMEVLLCLAEHAGKTVTKDQFMEEVWNDTVVTHDALLRCISELRKIFADDPREPHYIETIRKKGYRLIAPVRSRPIGPSGDDLRLSAASRPVRPGAPFHPPRPALEEPSPLLRERAAPSSLPRPAARPAHAPLLRQPRFWIAAAALLVLSAGSLVSLRRYLSPAPVLPLRALPLTSYPGVESDPNLSPEGDRIAFVWNAGDGGGTDVYIKQVGVETPLRLTRHTAGDASPAWSPDGRQIAFVRTLDEGSVLLLVPTAGGSERQVATFGTRRIRNVAWSPDGRTLALSIQRAPHGPFGLSLFSLDTREERPLTDPPAASLGDLEIAFSPDGSRLAFSRSMAEKVDDLYIVPVSGGDPTRITAEHAEITGLDWSADGKSLLYSSDREGSPALWRISASGGRPQWIPTTGEGSGVHQPSVARRGSRLSFVQRLQETNIWTQRLLPPEEASPGEAAAPRPLISSTRWDSNPDVSPDDTRIAFASNRSGSYEIWICNRDGSDPLQLTRFEGRFTNTPRWSPDGRHLAFVARSEDSADIYVLEVAGGSPVRITVAPSIDKAPSWSRDGRWIYFASNRDGSWQTWKIPATGGSPERVTEHGGYAARESLDGAVLYYDKYDASGIWRRPVGGGPEELVVEGLQPYDWGNWTVGPDGLYFIRRDPAGPVLARYRFETASVEVLTSLSQVPLHPGLALSPDGRQLFFTRVDRIEADILLVEGFQ